MYKISQEAPDIESIQNARIQLSQGEFTILAADTIRTPSLRGGEGLIYEYDRKQGDLRVREEPAADGTHRNLSLFLPANYEMERVAFKSESGGIIAHNANLCSLWVSSRIGHVALVRLGLRSEEDRALEINTQGLVYLSRLSTSGTVWVEGARSVALHGGFAETWEIVNAGAVRLSDFTQKDKKRVLITETELL